jgi:hypothetical protein
VGEQPQLLLEQERPEEAAVSERDVAEGGELGDRLVFGRFEQRPAHALYPLAALGLRLAMLAPFRSAYLVDRAACEWVRWNASKATSAPGTAALTAFS